MADPPKGRRLPRNESKREGVGYYADTLRERFQQAVASRNNGALQRSTAGSDSARRA